MKLEHLAAYLPYGAKVTKADWGKILKMDCDGTTLNCVGIDFVLHTNAKLVLRPLSDLTKEIEHNGEKFVPMDELWKYHNFSSMRWDDIEKDPTRYPFTIVEKLLEWKFDVFGLIEKGEAIDINTLNTRL